MDVLEPFLLDFDNSLDLNISEIERELIRLRKQRRVTIDFLKGEVPLENLLDCVADFGVDAYEYWEIVEDNINSLVDNKVIINNPSLILPIHIEGA